jgi:hypothetical protein
MRNARCLVLPVYGTQAGREQLIWFGLSRKLKLSLLIHKQQRSDSHFFRLQYRSKVNAD